MAIYIQRVINVERLEGNTDSGAITKLLQRKQVPHKITVDSANCLTSLIVVDPHALHLFNRYPSVLFMDWTRGREPYGSRRYPNLTVSATHGLGTARKNDIISVNGCGARLRVHGRAADPSRRLGERTARQAEWRREKCLNNVGCCDGDDACTCRYANYCGGACTRCGGGTTPLSPLPACVFLCNTSSTTHNAGL